MTHTTTSLRPASGSAADDPRVVRALEAYAAALQRGERPDRAEFLAGLPVEVADTLAGCLDGLELVHAAAPELSRSDGSAAIPDGLSLSQPLGDYRLIREVGRGGMGVVYEAEQLSLDRRVALKVLPYAATMDPKQLQRFRNEARAAASLHHEHIVPIHGVGCERGIHFYAMQFIEGQTLAEMIQELFPSPLGSVREVSGVRADHADTAPIAALPTERSGPKNREFYRATAQLIADAADALEHAHSLGIVHRDIKPANLMADAAGKIWVTDFGLARLGADAGLTVSGNLLGTLRYMAPEQALGKHGLVDHRADVYALGATFYELLTGHPAVDATERAEVLRQIAYDEPVAPRRLDKAIPAELETIALKCLAKSPAERYASAGELADDLRRWLDDQAIRAKPLTLRQRAWRWGRRHQALAWSAGATLFLAIVMFAGSVGYVASDRAARWAEIRRAVASALDDSIQKQRQGNYREALSAAKRAEGLAAGDAAGRPLWEQTKRRSADLELVLRLDGVRLEGTAVKDSHFDYELAERRYGEEFRAAGLDVDELSAEEAAALIRGTSVAAELAATLDDWATDRKFRRDQASGSWKHLMDVASGVDADEWRGRLREAMKADNRQALRNLAQAKDVSRQPAQSLYILGNALVNASERPAAAALLREAQRAYPGDFWINEDLGKVLAMHKPAQPQEAIRFLSVAVSLRPDSPGARLNLGAALADMGRMDEAIVIFEDTIRIKKDYRVAYDNLAYALLEQGKADEAMPWIENALRLKPVSAQSFNNLGRALQSKGRHDEAIEAYRNAISLEPGSSVNHNNLGTVLCDGKQDYDGAIASFREAIRLDSGRARYHVNLGNALKAKGLWDDAHRSYREAVRLEPGDPDGRLQLAGMLTAVAERLAGQKKHGEAEERCQEAEEQHRQAQALLRTLADKFPASADYRTSLAASHFAQADLLEFRKKHAEAEAEWRTAYALKKKLVEDFPEQSAHALHLGGICCNLGNVLVTTGKASESIEWYQRAIEVLSGLLERQPRLPTARLFLCNSYSGLSTAYVKSKRHDEALSACNRAIEFDDGSKRASLLRQRTAIIALKVLKATQSLIGPGSG